MPYILINKRWEWAEYLGSGIYRTGTGKEYRRKRSRKEPLLKRQSKRKQNSQAKHNPSLARAIGGKVVGIIERNGKIVAIKVKK